jgi:hypothetical protein
MCRACYYTSISREIYAALKTGLAKAFLVPFIKPNTHFPPQVTAQFYGNKANVSSQQEQFKLEKITD